MVVEITVTNDESGDEGEVSIAGYLTLAQVAERAGLKRSSLYTYVYRKSLPPPVRVGRGLIWPEEVIEEWLANRGKKVQV